MARSGTTWSLPDAPAEHMADPVRGWMGRMDLRRRRERGRVLLNGPVPYSEATHVSIVAAGPLGRAEDAARLRQGLRDYVATLRRTPAAIDYFATSLPTMLIFEEDVQLRQDPLADVLTAQLSLTDGDLTAADAALRRVLTADPAHPEAGRLLPQIRAAGG